MNEMPRTHTLEATDKTLDRPEAEKTPEPPRTHKLASPIQAYGNEVTEIVFRKPTGMDIVQQGNPVIFDPISDPPRITFDERKMTAMISALAKIPVSSVQQMDPRDWVACAWMVAPFFVPVPGSV